MEEGPFYNANQEKIQDVSEKMWANVLKKCYRHVRIRINQKTLFGAHTDKNLGENPEDYYVSYAYKSLLTGKWEWKDEYDLLSQLVRIIDSRISTEVDKTKTEKHASIKIQSTDDSNYLDNVSATINDNDPDKEDEYKRKVCQIENAIKGDADLLFFWECVKEGKKRAEIANLIECSPRQFDKLRERFIRTVRKSQTENL